MDDEIKAAITCGAALLTIGVVIGQFICIVQDHFKFKDIHQSVDKYGVVKVYIHGRWFYLSKAPEDDDDDSDEDEPYLDRGPSPLAGWQERQLQEA